MLTGHLGVEYGRQIADTPFLGAHEHAGTLTIHPGDLQHAQPWRNYENVKL